MLAESKVLKTHKNNKKLFNISIRNSTHNYISLALSVTYFVPPALLVCAGQSKCDISFWNSYSPNVAAKTLALLWPFHFHPASFPAFTNPAPLHPAFRNEILTRISLYANYANIWSRAYLKIHFYILFVMLMHNAQQFHTLCTDGVATVWDSRKLMAISQFALDSKYFVNYHRVLFKCITAALWSALGRCGLACRAMYKPTI